MLFDSPFLNREGSGTFELHMINLVPPTTCIGGWAPLVPPGGGGGGAFTSPITPCTPKNYGAPVPVTLPRDWVGGGAPYPGYSARVPL